jgi:hypothetical protein
MRRGVHDSTRADLEVTLLQHLAHLGEQTPTQLADFEEATKLQHGGATGNTLAHGVDTDQAAQSRVVQGRQEHVTPHCLVELLKFGFMTNGYGKVCYFTNI